MTCDGRYAAEAETALVVLAYCKEMKFLSLGANMIGDLGATKIAEAMPQMKNLQVLGLEDNPMSQEAKERLKQAWAAAGKKGGLST